MIGRRILERIVDATATSIERVNKSVAVLLDIHWLEKQTFVAVFRGILDQDARGAIEPPHLESCTEQPTIREKDIQACDRMETIDRLSILSIETVVGTVFNAS